MKSVIGVVSALALSTSVQAIPITGTLSYISATVPSNPNLNLATAFSFFPAGIVVSATGDLTGVGATVLNAPSISGLPLGIGPAPASVPVLGLWSGGGFTFDLLSLIIDFRSATQFTASGTGIITAAGFDPTPGTWTLAITGNGPVIGFAAGSEAVVASVPDGGSTLMLLAGALGALGWSHRRSRRPGSVEV